MKDIKRQDLIESIESGLKDGMDVFITGLKVIAKRNNDTELYNMVEKLHERHIDEHLITSAARKDKRD